MHRPFAPPARPQRPPGGGLRGGRRGRGPGPALAAPALLVTVIAALAPGPAPPAAAWDRTGHLAIARLAWERMSPEARRRAAELLAAAPADSDLGDLLPLDGRPEPERRREQFQVAAYWPDLVRDRGRARSARRDKYHRGHWHYMGVRWERAPGGEARVRDDLPPDPENVVERIGTLSVRLAYAGRADEDKAIDLAWLLHLVGDLHQPLHSASRVTAAEPEGDRGGNELALGGDLDLHWFWDTAVSEAFTRWFWRSEDAHVAAVARHLAERLGEPRLAGPGAPAGDPLDGPPVDPERWWRESFGWVTGELYPPELVRGRRPPRGYRHRAAEIAVERAALAGARLARLLDHLLAPASAAGAGEPAGSLNRAREEPR